MSYYNRRRYPSKASELQKEKDRQYAAMKARKAQWVTASGPVPLDVWQTSERIDSFDPSSDGVNTIHVVRYPSGGYYFMMASGMGWVFRPCNWVGEGEAP